MRVHQYYINGTWNLYVDCSLAISTWKNLNGIGNHYHQLGVF